MINLPEWKLTLSEPLYDTASKSPIEMTAQVYAKMRELVEAFNKLVEDVNKEVAGFENSTIANQEEFKCRIEKMILEYLELMDLKISNTLNLLIKYDENNEEVVIGGAE